MVKMTFPLSFFRLTFLGSLLCLILAGNLLAQGPAQPLGTSASVPGASSPDPGQFIVLNLSEGAKLIDKKPGLTGRLEREIKPESLLVLLDSMDITQILERTPQGFSYSPVVILPAGNHMLTISATDQNGQPLQKTLTFSNKHTEKFEELYSNNEASLIYDGALRRADTATTLPHSKIEGALRSDSKIKDKDWEVTFKTNLRYLDQSQAITPPQKIGIDAANFLLSGKYQKEATSVKGDLGDILVNESPFTTQFLARRGGALSFGYKDFEVRAFNVLSKQVYGLEDGTGVKLTNEDRILGTSAGIKLLNNRMEFRGIYLSGGEQGNSFGISTLSGNKKGEATALLLNTDFFTGMLKTELETAFSRFDSNTSDTVGTQESQARRFKIFGYKNNYNYEVLYEYIGKNYEVVGNPSIQKNKQGLSLKGGGNYNNIHQFNAGLLGYHDNVDGDSLLPRIYTYQGSLDYGFNKIQQLPMGFNYQRVVQESTSEPAGTQPTRTLTDTLGGRITLMKAPWNISFYTNYSNKYDQTAANSDTTTITYTLTPSFTQTRFTLTPSFSLFQTTTKQTDSRMDNFIINLMLSGKIMADRLSYDLTGTYNVIKTTNNAQDSRSLSGNFRIAYSLGSYLKGHFNSSIGLKGVYNHVADRVNPTVGRDEFSIFLVFSSTIPFGI